MSLQYPLTLCLRNGPWLYERDKFTQVEKLTTEIGIFLERVFRLTVKSRYRVSGNTWSFIGGPDKKAGDGFLHAHGVLTVPDNCRVEETLKRTDIYGLEKESVCRVVVGAALNDSTKPGWDAYSAVSLDDTIWYTVHRSLR